MGGHVAWGKGGGRSGGGGGGIVNGGGGLAGVEYMSLQRRCRYYVDDMHADRDFTERCVLCASKCICYTTRSQVYWDSYLENHR